MIYLDFGDEQLQHLGVLLRQDDERAFTEIYQRTRATFYAYAVRMLRNREDAEESINDAYLKLWKYRHRWDTTQGRFAAWLVVLMKRRIIDAQRMKQSRLQKEKKHLDHPDIIEDTLDVYATDPKPEPLAALIHVEQLQAIYDALLKIEHIGHRLSWRLKFFDGYKDREIACILNVPIDTAKMWHFRCTRKIRELLSEV